MSEPPTRAAPAELDVGRQRAPRRRSGRTIFVTAAVLLAGCNARERDQEPTVYDRDVAPIFASKCDSCHSGEAPPAGYRTGTFLDAVACVEPSGEVATAITESGAAPLLRALERDDHASLLSPQERTLVEAWIASGAPARRGAMHPPGMVDPRSVDFHARTLRLERWAPMFDPEHPGACGRCHEGAPVRPERIRGVAAGATPCTTCHETRTDGSFVCSTCHGDGERSSPPRDPCFFPTVVSDAHLAHVVRGRFASQALDCSTCHPGRDADVRTGAHGDRTVDVVFDPVLAGEDATFDPETGRCTNACHSREGERRLFSWRGSGALGCGDCHGIPPDSHYPGTCDRCHAEVSADGLLIDNPVLHLDGIVQHGNGASDCTSCHGIDEAGWPTTGAHSSHRDPTISSSVACDSCHRVPIDLHDAGHLDGVVQIDFGGLAIARGAMPRFDADAETCASVACHGEGTLGQTGAEPRWSDLSGNAARCGACHSVPPPPPHTTATTCGAVLCHRGEVVGTTEGLRITASGRALHIDGDLDVAGAEAP